MIYYINYIFSYKKNINLTFLKNIYIILIYVITYHNIIFNKFNYYNTHETILTTDKNFSKYQHCDPIFQFFSHYISKRNIITTLHVQSSPITYSLKPIIL